MELSESRRGQQPSPFHKITLSHHADRSQQHTSSVDSPRPVAAKVKKAAMRSNSEKTGSDRQAPARRGQRGNNWGKKKTSETTTSGKLESHADEVRSTVDGKTPNTTSRSSGDEQRIVSEDKGHSESETVDEGVDGRSCEAVVEDGKLSVSDDVTDDCGAVSDVEHHHYQQQQQQQQAGDTVKGRRCASVPAGNSRYSVYMCSQLCNTVVNILLM